MLPVFCLILLVAITPSVADEPQSAGPSGSASPEEVWDAYRFAMHDGRWREAYRCLAPNCQESCVTGVIFAATYLDDSDTKGTAKKLKIILINHGLDMDSLCAKASTDPSAAEGVISHVKDKEGLFCDANSVLRPLAPNPKDADGKPVVEFGKLTSVQVTGDKAEGKYMRQLDDKKETFIRDGVRQSQVEQEATFRKVDGRWFYSGGS